jgi:hypothetical protein
MRARELGLPGWVLGALLGAGCVQQDLTQGVARFGYPAWTIALAALAGAGLVCVAAVKLWRGRGSGAAARDGSLYRTLAVLGAFTLLVVPGQLHVQRVTVDAEGFSCADGFWMFARRRRVNFDDVASVYVSTARVAGARSAGRPAGTVELWSFVRHDGTTVPLDTGGRVMRAAMEEVERRLRERGIVVETASPSD